MSRVVSTCAVHEVILDDRPLDQAQPLWPTGHYGAHKAALRGGALLLAGRLFSPPPLFLPPRPMSILPLAA